MAKLKISLLGGFRAECDPRSRLVVSRKKGQALLALLALRPGSGYPREALTALLWPDAGDDEARHSLRQELHELRRALAALRTRALVIDGERLALDAGAVEVDVAAFERLAALGTPDALKRAAALYEGDLLSGIGVRESAFEDYLRTERERLRARATGVFTRLLEHQTKTNALDAATETALRLLAMDPTQESVHRALMRLYARSGRRAAALRQYQACVEVLQRELDVEPEAATREIYREILASRQPERSAAARERPAAAGGRRDAAPRADLGVDPPLAGRSGELARIAEVLDQTCARRGHVLTLLGEAGIGKTRLVTEIAALALERDGRTIVGRAYETAQVLAFGPWVDALRAGLAAEPDALAGVPPPWRAELARVLPEVEGRAARRAAPADATRIFEAVSRLVERLAARRPLVVVLEDVHWADELTLRLAAYVGRRIDAAPVLLVLTAREEHLTDNALLDVTLKELATHARRLSLPVGALSRAETTALARSLARAERDQAAFSRLDERVWQISAGNPLLVLESVRALREAPALSSLPTRVREIVATRLERLSERGRRVVSIASVIGRECDFRLLQQCAGLDDRDAAEVIEELVRRRVFQGHGERLDFSHDRLREAAAAALVPAQVRSLHRLIATSMETVYAGDFERHYAPLAAHCRDGELWEKAAAYLAEAGTRAAERSAHREAAASFEQALAALGRLPGSRARLAQSVDVGLALHTSRYALGEVERSYQALRDAEAPARSLGDPRRLALLASQTGQYFWVTGRAREALPLFEHAAAVAKTLDDFALQTSATLYIASSRFALGDLAAAEAGFRHVIEAIGESAAAEKLGLHGLPLVFAESGLTAICCEQGRFDEARAHGARSMRIAEALDHTYTLVFALRTVGHAHTIEGRLADAIAVLERGRALCADPALRSLAPNIMASLGYAYSIDGRPHDGVQLLERALAALEEYGQRVWYVLVLDQLAEARLLGGDAAGARDAASRALAAARERGERAFEAAALRMLGAVETRMPSPDAGTARGCFETALALAEERGMRPLVAHCHAGLADLCARLGDADRAAQHRETALGMCREIGISAPPPYAAASAS